MKKMTLNKGILILVEGIDGAGKSTQACLLLQKLLALGYDAVAFREPTGGKWGREIKKRAKNSGSLTPEEELTLFIKDRGENVRKNLRPALDEKKVVVLDRYYFSTVAYQGARGINPSGIRKLNEKFAPRPDLVFILDIDPGKGLERIQHRKRKDLLFERKKYLARVSRIFQSFRGRGFIHLDALRPKEELHKEILTRVLRYLEGHSLNP